MGARNRIYLSLGSNLGDRLGYIASAVEELKKLGSLLSVSTVYESDPWGYRNQPKFLNCVLLLETSIAPEELLRKVKDIERRVGRIERFRWGPREIDIDILLCEGRVIKTPELEVPHPRMRERDFVLVPLTEIEEGIRDPVTGKPFKEFLRNIEVSLRPYCCLLTWTLRNPSSFRG